MQIKLVLAVFALLGVAANALLVPPPCAQYAMSDTSLGATPGFIPNVIFYNGNSLMSGTPVGPYYGLNEGPNCYFIPNTSLSCGITLYQDAARTQPIGSGTLSGIGSMFSSNGFIGGDVQLSYTITPGAVTISPSPFINFQSRTVTLHFKAEQTYPSDHTQAAVANKAIYSSDLQSGALTLWGSNGWNGSAFVNYDLGFDFRATLNCVTTPPIIVPCSPAAGSAFSVPYGCAQSSQPIRFHSSSTSIGLSFVAGAAATCSNF